MTKVLVFDQCRFVVGNEQVAVHSVWISGEVALDNPIDQRPILSEVNEIFFGDKEINNQWLMDLFSG
ncbi:hypothetical protein BGL48_14065 [Salinivibrio sp. SS3]|uniref:hypothetical protein n=1 Tax=Salinivibrio sp. SS3 TaxID=1895021 RepID=UPI00086D88CF|nr:hypothetical protein [Salinivibrio sp. BNH]ODP97422.1 hypothetical protein BGL48_14065 [Salinivibrio sp. BNH]